MNEPVTSCYVHHPMHDVSCIDCKKAARLAELEQRVVELEAELKAAKATIHKMVEDVAELAGGPRFYG